MWDIFVLICTCKALFAQLQWLSPLWLATRISFKKGNAKHVFARGLFNGKDRPDNEHLKQEMCKLSLSGYRLNPCYTNWQQSRKTLHMKHSLNITLKANRCFANSIPFSALRGCRANSETAREWNCSQLHGHISLQSGM